MVEFLQRCYANAANTSNAPSATCSITADSDGRHCEVAVNLTKRQIGAAIAFNFSLLMRHFHGIGTPKQWEAAIAFLIERLSGLVGTLRTTLGALLGLDRRKGFRSELSRAIRQNAVWATLTTKVTRISKGC